MYDFKILINLLYAVFVLDGILFHVHQVQNFFCSI